MTFFDLDRGASALVQRNLAKLGCERERARVVAGDVITAARRGRMPGAPFDVVLIDPPYALGTSPAENLVSALASRGLLAHGAIALFERISPTPALVLEGFDTLREKRYGQTCIDLLRYQ